jgi:serine/threonine-protein kinase
MALAPGTRFGPYQLSAQIGAGGMGEVYRATDTNLARQVAVKVLPQSVAADAERLARFDREARTLAALNHPNIAAIYGVEKGDGTTTALVMELIEGPTLADRIVQGTIPLEETLRIARQIAEALEAAHEQGIVHRDLKPANIKLRRDGTVKVLDFGLAKTTAVATATSALASASPTLTTPAMTHAGIILGTAAYMSPEQAKGHDVDQRCDVWAFACVLYEMLTGRRAFPGNGVTETLAAILERDVDWERLPASTPASVRTLLRRALAKDLRRRLHHIADARLELEEVHAAPAQIKGGSRRVPWLWLAGAAVALIAVAVGAWRLSSASSNAMPVARLSIAPEPALSANAEGVVAISPDGQHIVYVSGQNDMLYVRDIDRFEARPLPGTEGADTPAFSPDGAWIAFFAGGKVKKVALAGGTAITLAEIDEGFGLAWESDASIMFNPGRVTGIWRVPAVGGKPQEITNLQGGQNRHRDPEALPGGKAILYASNAGPGTLQIFAQSLETGERHLIDRGTSPHYLRSGHIAYVQDGSLMVAPFDVSRLEKTGSAVVALTGVRQTSLGTAQIVFSQTGAMAYVPTGGGGRRDTLVWVDRSGAEQPTTVSGEAFSMPRLAPDVKRVAVAIGASTVSLTQGDLWIYDLTRDTRSRLTFDGVSTFPLWEPGGRRLLLSSGQSGKYQLVMKTLDGTAPDAPMLSERPINYPLSWSPDGRFVATVTVDTNSANDIWVLTPGTAPAWQPFVQTRFREGAPTFSHDSRLIAYASDQSGRSEIYVRPFPGPGEAITVSTRGGSEPLFARNAPMLFYRRGEEMMSVEIAAGPPIQVGTERRVFERGYNRSEGFWPNFDVTPDGRRLILIRGAAQDVPSRVNVVLNWSNAMSGNEK